MEVMTLEQSLQAVRDAMLTSVIPALPLNEPIAMEAATLIVGYLGVMSDQVGHQIDLLFADLRSRTELLASLVESSAGGPSTQQSTDQARDVLMEGLAVSAVPLPSQAHLTTLNGLLYYAIDNIVVAAREDGSDDFKARVGEVVLSQAEIEILRARVTVRMTGFEGGPQALPDYDQVTGGAAAASSL